ncbi:MAG: hypothetical protein PVG03_15515 [Desulfarculaceae bacterium]|jgi:hypothetical protein
MKPGQILAAALAAALLGMIMPAFARAQGNPAGLGKPRAIAACSGHAAKGALQAFGRGV